MDATAVLLLLVLPGALAGPVQWTGGNDMCSNRCPESVKFKYEPGSSYEYDYEAETRTTMSGAAEDTATITISGIATIDVLDHCEMALRLTDVAIKRSHEQNPERIVAAADMSRARSALEGQSLRFAFYDGTVGDLCPEDDEELWALNVKRGVLTSFQNSMRQMEREEHLQEADVTGQCPTHYKITQRGLKTLKVSKVKDMLSCINRHDYRTSLLSTPYKVPNSLQSLPLLKSSHECTHDISKEKSILEFSSCHEVHVFRPFSKAASGAVTEASHTLTFRSQRSSLRTGKGAIGRRTTLVYEHKQGKTTGESQFSDVKNKLKEICDVTKIDIRPQVPHLFGELVHMMRSLDYGDLQDLNRQLERNKICSDNAQRTKKFFQDALPMTATGASLRMMSDLLTSDEVKDAQASFWLTSLAFAPNPTKDMIAAVQPLLTNEKIREDAMLAVSSLANNYCEHTESCEKESEVQQVVDTLTHILGSDCQVDNNNFKLVMTTLRAIGNIGRSDLASLRLQKCFTQSDLPMDVRVAALDAYRRMPCSADRNDAMETFLRHSEDSELRIAAYLTVMKCPTDHVLTKVRQALQAEEVNQVGSFVWTHLTNLLETDSPHKQAIRDVLENELLQKEFKMDRRKYSRNTELSFFSDKFNVGGTYEGNLIWSPNSFIPRSAMMNLTVDIFGHSVNLLEVGGRVQGLEYLLQAYFDTDNTGKEGGYGQTNAIKTSKLARTKASFGKVKDDLRAQMYLRVFGNELAYGMMDGTKVKGLKDRKVKAFFDDLVEKLMKEGEVSFTQSAMFLDSTIVVPTVVGLPLNLTVNGSASLELEASQKMDFMKINAKSKAFEIAASIEPSGAVELASMMSVDASVATVGLKMISRLHTSTSVKGRVELARGQILSVEVDTPRETMELFDFQSKFFIVHDSHEKEQSMITTNRKEKRACTGEPLAKIVGMELCASLAFPNATTALSAPYFPFTGPTSVSLTLRKHDVHSGYRLFAKQIKTSSSIITQIALDTPGSKVDRAISLGYVANLKAKTLEADLLSPWKKVSVKMSMINNKKLYKAEATVTMDVYNEYKVEAQVEKDIKDRKELIAKVKPSLVVISPNGTLISVSGNLDYRQNKMVKTNVVVEMKDVLKKPITLDYSLIMRGRPGKMRYKNNLKLASQFAVVKSSLQAMVGSFNALKRSALLTVRSRVDYNLPFWPRIKKNQVNMGLKIHDRSTSSLRKYGFSMNCEAKRTPEANMLMTGEASHKKTLSKVEVNIRHGKNVKLASDKSKEFVIAAVVAHKIADPQASVNFDLKAVYPDKNIDYQITGKHDHNKRMVEDYVTVRYAKGKSIDAHMRLAQQKKKRSATFDLSYPGEENYPARVVKINADLLEKSENHHILSALASLQKKEKHSFVMSFKRPTDNSVEISSEMGIHGRLPVKLELSGNYALRDMKGQGELSVEGKTYRLNYTSDIQKDKYGKFALTFVHPERRIEAFVEGGSDTNESVKRAKMLVLWDANKDVNQKAGVTMEIADKINPEDVNLGGMLEVFTPVQDYRHLKGELRFENSDRRLLTALETVLGDENKDYSARFMLGKPLTPNRFKTQLKLKTPFQLVKHIEANVDHTFDGSSKLSTALKGVLNKHSVEMGVLGSSIGNLVTRVYEGEAFFKSSLRDAENFRLTFNHRDANGRYNTQTLLNANGDQYSAAMEANFQKVHYQITTDGELAIRAPQLSSPVKATWNHRNSLHDLSSVLTFALPEDQKVKVEVSGNANIVTKVYEGTAKLTGPWKENGREHISNFHMTYSGKKAGYDVTANLLLDQDSYILKQTKTRTDSNFEMTTALTMSRFPEYSFHFKTKTAHDAFPYKASLELEVAERPLLLLSTEVENPKLDKYEANSRMMFAWEDIQQNIVISSRHDKNRRKQWVSKGSVEYEAGKTISFSSVVGVEKNKKMISLDIDTPFDDVWNIHFDYTHSGHVNKNFQATSSLSMDPMFDKVSAEASWSNDDQVKGRLRVDTPFKELRHLEVNSGSWLDGEKRHCSLTLDYPSRQTYKLETVSSTNFPHDLDLMLDVTTPRTEFPSLHTHMVYRYLDHKTMGNFTLVTPVIPYDIFAVSFNQESGPKSCLSQVSTVLGTQNTWSSHMNVSWAEEIDGLLSVENIFEGQQKMHLLLSHSGHTWQHFRSKAGFMMNGDRLESEMAYSNRDGHSGLFMLATPDRDIDFIKTTFFHRLTASAFEGRYTAQYGETSKPYDLGLTTTYNEDKIAFSAQFKSPHSEDLQVELGFAATRYVEVKLYTVYGADNKLNILVKYNIKKEFWDVGGEFEYLIQGSGRNIGLIFKRDGPLDNLKVTSTGKYMGKEVSVDTLYKDGQKKTGRVDVRTNFDDYTNLAASFAHSGDSEKFETNVYLKVKDDKEAKGSIDFQRNKWKRVVMTTSVHLPFEEFKKNRFTYKHTNRKNKLSAEGSLTLGSARPITGELEFVDNSKLKVSVTGSYKDFESLVLTGTYDDTDKQLEGEARVTLASQRPITASYMVRAVTWPIMVNVKTETPFEGWKDVELSITHDGDVTDFTSSHSLTSDAVGKVTSELVWTYTSPSVLDGLWTVSSSVEGMQDLKLAIKNSQAGEEYASHFVVGWELLKEIILDGTINLNDRDSNKYKGSVSMTSPFTQASQFSVFFDHSHDDRFIQDSIITRFNDKTYLDADFDYSVGERRVGRMDFREPRPMEFLIGGSYSDQTMEGELKVNWDKRYPEMNIHLTGEHTDNTDQMGTDVITKVWAIHPARTMGMEYVLKKADKEFQSDFLFTWDKSAGQTMSYVITWTDRSTRYTSAYDAMVKLGVPMRSIQLEGKYSSTERAKAAEGAILWDADRDTNMKVGVKGLVDKRGNTNKVKLDLDLPFVDKEYSLMTETALNTGNTLLDARTEFSYSLDPRKLVVVTTQIEDISYGRDTTNYSVAFSVIHPMTDINVKMTSHFGNSEDLSSMATSVEYMTAQRAMKMVELRGQIDKLQRRMDVGLKSPIKEVSLEGRLTGDRNYNFRLLCNEDGQRSQVTDIFINPKKRTFELTFKYDKAAPKNSVNLFGHMVSDNLLQTELYRMQDGQRVSETLLTVRLNSSHVLHTRFNWRPQMLSDLQAYLGTQLTVFSYSSSETFKAAAQIIGHEVQAKYEAIMSEVKEEMGPLLQQFQRELQSLRAHMDSMQTDMRRFYYSNALHIQDMGAMANQVLESMVLGMQELVVGFDMFQSQLQEQIDQILQQMGRYPMAQRYGKLVADFAAGLKNSRVVLEQALDQLSQHMAQFYESSYRRYLIISRQIDRKLEGYTAALRKTPQFHSMEHAYNTARSSLATLSRGDYKKLSAAANEKLLEALERAGLKETYVLLVTRTSQLISDQFHDLVARPEFQQIYVIGNEIYQQGVWAYHYWHVEKNAKMAMGQLLELAKDVTLLEITRVKNAVVDLDKSRVIVFDPQNGELQFEIYVPVALKSLSEPPDMRVTKYVNRLRSWAATYIPVPKQSLWTTLNNYLPSTDTDTWLPPFTAHAYVMGDQHIVTFDQKHYNFAGRCSYILARDMVDDRFTVILNYNNRPRQPQVQSVIVLLRGMAIEVDRDYKVKVNDQERELPFFTGVISAVRQQSIVRIQDGQALTVEIDSTRGIYSVKLSGWYHGQTAGLLGTFDNEPFNDLTTSKREMTNDLEDFTNSWEVNRRYCRSRNLAESGDVDSLFEEFQSCQQFLNQSSSYFSPCFGQIDASELVQVCMSYVKTGVKVQEARCKAGQHYRYMCQHRGISLGTPSECVKCELSRGDILNSGEVCRRESEKGQHSADVVFIVEESSCNSWAQRSLATLATQLAQSLKDKGVTENRFGLVSYAGNGSHDLQLAHTIEGKVFGEPGSFLKATESLRLTYHSTPGNAGAALREAVKYPFRVGVAKLLVMLPCSACTGDLYTLGQVLTSHGFKLHVLSAQDFSVRESSNASPVRVFGVDSNQAHTQKSAARKSDAIFQKLPMPQDACSQLALSTNGSVFDASHMKERRRVQNEFMESFASQGASNAVTPSCQVCSCHDDGTGRGHTVCRLCDNNSWLWNHIPSWLQSSSTSVMGVFNDLHHQIINSVKVPEVAIAA